MRFALIVFLFAFGVSIAVSRVEANANVVTHIVAPWIRAYPHVYSAHSSSLVTPTQQQYHTQDGLGQYAYGYAEPHSAKQEVRSLDGTTRGSYSYRDAAGELQIVDYTADDNGFHVAATNFPHNRAVEGHTQQQPFRGSATSVGNTITTDVATASDIRHTGHQEALLRLAKGGDTSSQSSTTNSDTGSIQLSQPVANTIAVAAAKAEHLKRHDNEKHLHEFALQGLTYVPPIVSTTIPRAVIPSIYNYGYPWRYYNY